MNTEESVYLLERYFYDLATHAEREALFRALEENPDAEQWQMLMLKLIPANQPQADMEQKYEDMLRSITRKQAKVKKMPRRYWLWAAASAVFILALGIYFYAGYNHRQPAVTAAQSTDVPAPQVNRALITLADGRTVYLDEQNNGQVAEQGTVKVVKLDDGRLVYQAGEESKVSEIQYNTLSNPRGSKVIDMVLADGTRVWLNAESSITYPVTFIGKERKVELKGEGYFEVAHDASKPFSVETGGMNIKVLGTHFNVNAYEDEGGISTTLLQGSVSVSANGKAKMLKPGQQAVFETLSHELQTSNDIDIEQVMAWKNGYFSFQDASLKDIMRQISRWYDVDVGYEGKPLPREFGGVISRSADLGTVLKILEASNVHFRLEGKDRRKLIVFP